MSRLVVLLSCLFLLACPAEDAAPLPELGDCPTSEDFFAVRISPSSSIGNCAYCHIEDAGRAHPLRPSEPAQTDWLAHNCALARELA